MLCAIDVDGLDAAELGLQRRQRRPALHRHGRRAGAAGRRQLGRARAAAPTTPPSVFAEVARYRAFITDPLADVGAGADLGAHDHGRAAASAPGSPAPSRATPRARPRSRCSGSARAARQPKNVGHARTYRVTKADAGHPLVLQRHGQQRRRHLDRAVRADLDGEDPEVAQGRRASAGGGRVLPDRRPCPAGLLRPRRGPRAFTPSWPQLLRRPRALGLSAGVSPPLWSASALASQRVRPGCSDCSPDWYEFPRLPVVRRRERGRYIAQMYDGPNPRDD